MGYQISLLKALITPVKLKTVVYFLNSNPKHVEWARSFLKVLTDLQEYVKEYHGIGVFWNKEVIDVFLFAENALTVVSL